jgi:hypothetical protein
MLISRGCVFSGLRQLDLSSYKRIQVTIQYQGSQHQLEILTSSTKPCPPSVICVSKMDHRP